MAYIDEELLKRNIRVNLMPNVDIDGTVTVENAERYFLNLIDKTSTADVVVEVIRCKDCQYWNPIGFAENGGWCEKKDIAALHNGFCESGERKSDE